jgi:hypothetical protein
MKVNLFDLCLEIIKERHLKISQNTNLFESFKPDILVSSFDGFIIKKYRILNFLEISGSQDFQLIKIKSESVRDINRFNEKKKVKFLKFFTKTKIVKKTNFSEIVEYLQENGQQFFIKNNYFKINEILYILKSNEQILQIDRFQFNKIIKELKLKNIKKIKKL